MIKFDVVDDGYFGQVVHELRPLVEVGSVVFIALEHKKFRALLHMKTMGNPKRHTADEIRRLLTELQKGVG